MITIAHNNVSKFIGKSADAFVSFVKLIDFDDQEIFIWDLNDQNAAILDISGHPDDWMGGKYLYIEDQWSLNPDYENL